MTTSWLSSDEPPSHHDHDRPAVQTFHLRRSSQAVHFGKKITKRTLRTAYADGRLQVTSLAGKKFVTLGALEAMVEANTECPDPTQAQDSSSNSPAATSSPNTSSAGTRRGRKKEKSTGKGPKELEAAEGELQTFIDERWRPSLGRRHPHQIKVGEVLDYYDVEHAPHTEDPDRISYAIDALEPYWEDKLVSEIRGTTCREYAATRTDAGRTEQTARKELAYMCAALNHCVREGHLSQAPGVWMPELGESKERWLTRKEAAQLLRARLAHETRQAPPRDVHSHGPIHWRPFERHSNPAVGGQYHGRLGQP